MSNRARVLKPDYIVDHDMGASFDGPWLNVEGVDNLSFDARWASSLERTIVVTDTDSVDVSEETWIFANGAFTEADVGGSFTITGTTGGLNDGTYEIASVTDSETVVSVETPGGSDETFDGTEVLTLQQLDPTGVFSIEVSNDGPVVDSSTRQEQPSGQVGASTIYTESTINPAEDEGARIIPLTNRAERWARFNYAATTGGGLLSVAFAGKGT